MLRPAGQSAALGASAECASRAGPGLTLSFLCRKLSAADGGSLSAGKRENFARVVHWLCGFARDALDDVGLGAERRERAARWGPSGLSAGDGALREPLVRAGGARVPPRLGNDGGASRRALVLVNIAPSKRRRVGIVKRFESASARLPRRTRWTRRTPGFGRRGGSPRSASRRSTHGWRSRRARTLRGRPPMRSERTACLRSRSRPISSIFLWGGLAVAAAGAVLTVLLLPEDSGTTVLAACDGEGCAAFVTGSF